MREAEERALSRLSIRAAVVSTVCNILLAVVKLVAGLVGHSSAMISDAVNSTSDVISNFVVISGVAASDKEADTRHQYGHEKIEGIVSLFLAAAISITGCTIGYSGIRQILEPERIVVPSLFPLLVAVGTMVVKELLYQYTIRISRKTGSHSLRATAWDHRSDVLSSLGAFIGILGARLGLPILDPIASLVICLLIIKVAVDIFKAAFDVLLDSSVDESTRQQLEATISAVDGVKEIDLLKTRITGSRYYVEVEIRCCRYLPLFASHAIAQTVHDRIERKFSKVKHVVVHTNPCDGTEAFCKPSDRNLTIADR
jgi:cation diffusion facilitator family transporter